MRHLRRYTLLFLLLPVFAGAGAGAQSPQRKEILQELNSTVYGKGRVTVYEDESIGHILGRPMSPPRKVYTSADGATQYYRVRGYKIQAFSGNDQRTSKNEAQQKQQQINSAYPAHETTVLFESPFWRLRVGNFEHRHEAEEVMKEMIKTFPSFGKEMYIVVDEVKIPLDHTYGEEH
ncbi:MAG: SPOR domain-containing protein [Proteiniphilum sp.]|jgi:hypothetical protein|nr:SPOR domain-containing protein [Proteiniphilum sp.]